MKLPPARKYGPPSKILVIIIKDIGDVILTEPSAQILKYNYPGAQIDFLAAPRCATALAHNPFVDNVVTYDKDRPLKEIFKIRARKYHWVLDFLNNPRSAVITAFSGAALRAGRRRNRHSFYAYNFKFEDPKEHLYASDFKLFFLKQLGLKWPCEHAPLAKYYLSKEELSFRDASYKSLGVKDGETVIGFYPTPRMETRRWPAAQFRETAKLLYGKYKAKIFVFYGPGEEGLAKAVTENMPLYIRLAPPVQSLGNLMALLSRLNILIASCGGTKNMAIAAGVPTVTTHTVNRASNWTPSFDPRHIAVSAENTPCSPCFRRECNNNFICMADVSPLRVFKAAQKILDADNRVADA